MHLIKTQCPCILFTLIVFYISGDGAHGRPWDIAGNSVLAMQYGSLYYRPADLSNVTMKLVKCGQKLRHGLCVYNRTEALEACKPHNRKLRLAQKVEDPQKKPGRHLMKLCSH